MTTVAQKRTNKWFVLFMLILTYIFAYGYAATSLATFTRTIMEELNFSLLQITTISGMLPIGIAVFTFIAGVLLDKFSTRILMFISIIICCACIGLRGFATSFSTFAAAMFILGMGQAILFPGVTKVITSHFGKADLFRANGILISGAPIGMIAGFNTSIPFATAVGGWQNMFKVWGALGIVVAIIYVIVIRDVPKEEQALNKDMGIDTSKSSVGENLKAVLAQKQTWLIVIADMFYQGYIQTAVSYGAVALGQFPGATAQLAATTSSMGNLGSLFGYYILPPISERFGVRKPFVWPSMAINSVLVLAAFLSNSFLIAGILFFIGYFFNGWSVPGGRTMIVETPGIAGLRAGTAVGLLITMQRVGAFVFPILFALIAGAFGDNQIIAMVFVCLAPLVSAVFIMLTKETGMGREAAKKLHEEKKAARLSGK